MTANMQTILLNTLHIYCEAVCAKKVFKDKEEITIDMKC